MNVLVVYESMFGNTAEVAIAIAEGLCAHRPVHVDVREIAKATSTGAADVIIAGAPTHAFSLSRPSTRQDALDRGASLGYASAGMREWLDYLAPAAGGQQFAAFDTRVSTGHRLPGSAAAKAVRIARRLDYAIVGQKSFLVNGISGPLRPGELGRARAWGSDLATLLARPRAGRTAASRDLT